MNRIKKLSLTLMCCLIILLIANNAIYYLMSKRVLEERTLHNLVSESRVINTALENSRESAQFIEGLVGEKLRSDSIAIQSQLDPDFNKVTNEQLEVLSQKLGLKAITLLTRNNDSFILSKSSHLEEINLDTKNWGLWNKAFLELYENNNVTKLNWGQSLPNYWAGPYSISNTNAEEFYKYGYYYDGSTNYIINPFVSDKVFRDYDAQSGINAVINDILSTSSILEVSGINPATFGKEPFEVLNDSGQKYTVRYFIPIFFGSYLYNNEERDSASIQEAIQTNKPVSYKTTIEGKKVFKTFIPVFTDQMDSLGVITENSKDELEEILSYYVMSITLDYQEIQHQLNKLSYRLLIVVIVVTMVCVLIMVVLNHYINKSKDEAVSATQQTYIEELNNLFDSIRGQRHDFLNHITTIHAFVELKKYSDLKGYIKEMVGEITNVNEIINIGQPAIAALIQSKMVQASHKDITFNYAFYNIKAFPDGVKSVDFVRFMGNLIDNAFDEVMSIPQEERRVELIGKIIGGSLQITVKNPGTLDEKIKDKLFVKGQTSKSAEGHSGLGLAITMDIVKKYKGTIQVNNENGVEFIIDIPIHTYPKVL